ncbi:MAG: HypC/HybG/HupF family hydrogenase formation chaperone [Bdellovibrionaceae bacterium]|mgnify:CR=1 FL=1|jgi:hydrogenase expression/formation protein HypC|nr:HypC/HybG/HupF family hydrogenase formation chaperone [Pseudobdellovibrionaceae bacterium]
MCLAVPAKIYELHESEMATIELSGLKKKISIALVPEVKIGDYVVVHVGYALSVMDEEEANLTLKSLEKMNEIY